MLSVIGENDAGLDHMHHVGIRLCRKNRLAGGAGGQRRIALQIVAPELLAGFEIYCAHHRLAVIGNE
ncbi:hypothetical protein D3C71_1571860 [compost metagenome]